MRSRSMQALTNDLKARYPGIVIYGVGNDAHKTRLSDHNEDDTPGSLAAQSDADSIPEHRAIDVMLGPAFSKAQANAVIAEILAQPRLLTRLFYINFLNWQWPRSNGWLRRDNSSDPHPTHIHFSGRAADDDNPAPWLTGDDDMSWSEILPLPSDEFPELQGQTKEKASLILAWTGARARRLEVQLAEVKAKLDTLSQPVAAPVDMPALLAVLRPELDAVVERAVRAVLGSLDESKDE